MKNLLVKFRADYADEFDVYGFRVIPADEWEDHLKEAEATIAESGDYKEMYFGSNEAVVVEDVEQYKQMFTATEISDAELEVLIKLFGISYRPGEVAFGHFLTVEN